MIFNWLQRLLDRFTGLADDDMAQIQEDPIVLPVQKPLSEADLATLRLVHSCNSPEGINDAVTLAGSEH